MNRYDLAVQDSGNGLWDWDLTTSRIHYSPGWISMLGGAGVEFGNTLEEWFKRIHPEDREFVQREIHSLLLQEAANFELQHRMLHQDGCYRWMLCRGAITRDGAGRAIRISGCHIDITAEKVVDELTGLPNRLLLMDRLTRSIEKARKYDDFLFAVMIADLDLFQSGISRLETVNADTLLIAAARRLELTLKAANSSTRENRAHLVARSGGEEFIVLLDGLSTPAEAKSIADHLLREMLAPFDFEGHEVFLSPSIGIALSATGYDSAEEALRDADAALYRAKSFGKSRCEVFDTAVLESTRAWDQLERDLREGLARNEFRVFYQPIVSLPQNTIAGFEALVRWNHPTRGLIFPKDFIPAAEKSGLIVPLDKCVLKEACRQLRSWKSDPGISKDLWISINLSGAQLKHPSMLKDFRDVLAESGLNAAGLVLELTEESIMENPDAARTLLMQLRVMGARIALDDFGTGYSSLAHLRRFPLDYLKIDHSFVRSLGSADNVEIVRAINVMARQLGLHVIAEGIENSRQLELIRSLGCQYGQGFLCARAVESKEAERLVRNSTGFPEMPQPADSSPAPPGTCQESRTRRRSFHLKPDLISGWKARNTGRKAISRNRKIVLIALPFLILLVMGGLLSRLNRFTAPPVAYTSPQVSPPAAAANQPQASSRAVVNQSTLVVPRDNPSATAATRPVETQKPKPAAPVKKSTEMLPLPLVRTESKTSAPLQSQAAKPRELMATYPVVHDHRIGSCRGDLIIEGNHLLYVSEKSKDSFDLKVSDVSFSMDKDQLVIRSGSKIFRFKPGNTSTPEENKARLIEIYQTISRSNGL